TSAGRTTISLFHFAGSVRADENDTALNATATRQGAETNRILLMVLSCMASTRVHGSRTSVTRAEASAPNHSNQRCPELPWAQGPQRVSIRRSSDELRVARLHDDRAEFSEIDLEQGSTEAHQDPLL